jgi:pimeloyl-ACP methyl ester carboxylesterase/DNA-binding CsgD family transcriptional regulator
MEPVIQYARTSDGANIAYYSIGEGSQTLVHAVPGSHLEKEWEYPEQRAFLERLASKYRLIRFDFRGSGLSDRGGEVDIEFLALDIDAVARHERLKRFALGGGLFAAAAAVLYACKYPERVSHLVLWSAYVENQEMLDASPPLQAARAAATKDWETFTQFMSELLTGWLDMDQARRLAAYFRASVDADQYARFSERFMDLDLTEELGTLQMPVLVLHRKNVVFPPIEAARRLATNIPGARLVLLDGSAVVPFLGDVDAVLATIEEFLAHTNEPRPGGLTKRELEILALVAGGASNEGIARALSISARTVERHIGNIYLKIGAHNRAEATAYAFRERIASPS